MIDIFFVGNFLSKSIGTFPISESVANQLKKNGFTTQLCSSVSNQFMRLIDIIYNSFVVNYGIMHIDIYSGSAFMISEFSSRIAKLRGKKIIITLHGGNLPSFFETNKDRIKSVFKRADHIQTPSLSLQEFFSKEGIKINYLPNLIDLSNFPFDRSSVKPKSLLWVRAFNNIYNPELAIKAIYEVKKTYPETTLTMIGPDKGSLAEVKQLIKQLNLSSCIDIVGPIKNKKLYKYYQTHEVYLNTTSLESFGVAVIEAASCGIPIVSSEVGEMTWLWKDEENILFAKLDAVSFAEKIERLFVSDEFYDLLSLSARNRIEEFDVKNIINNWEETLSILAKKTNQNV